MFQLWVYVDVKCWCVGWKWAQILLLPRMNVGLLSPSRSINFEIDFLRRSWPWPFTATFEDFMWTCGRRNVLIYSFLLKVRYGFGWRLSNALIIIFHTFFQWVTWDTWSRLSGLWPRNAWLSSHLCDWGHVWFSHSVKLLSTFICDVHWLVICDFQRPHSVTPGWYLICLHCANALIGAGVKFSLFLLFEIVENFWIYITRIHLSDMALQFRADADPGPSLGGLHRRVLTPKLSNKLIIQTWY